ncbi:hypothetical protein GCM10009662_58240 [Catellatospora coxensis]|uniref:Uncharacterized protein n=1 Tax=Catellatospora coxensis TaxID=310354 RepID=A0A8J3P8E1_9ACTN|nr:hypothetical protein Cco03nite_43070 [Catellatospora coxensis]
MPAAPAIDDLLADLALQTRRLRVAAWAVGGAGLLAAAVVAELPGDLWIGRLASGATVVATCLGYLLAVRPLWRLRRAPVLTPLAPSGFTTAASPRHHANVAYLLAVAGFAWGVDPYVAVPLVLLLAALVGLRPARIVLTPGAVLVRRLRTRRVPWAQLTVVRVTSSGLADELSLTVDVPGRGLGTVRARLDRFDVDQEFLVHTLRHYAAVPEDRTAIGAPAELARRRAAYLADAGRSAVETVGAAAADPGAEPAVVLP